MMMAATSSALLATYPRNPDAWSERLQAGMSNSPFWPTTASWIVGQFDCGGRVLHWKMGDSRRISGQCLLKIAIGAGLAMLTLGVIPDKRRGAVVAIGTCITAALVLHFVAP